jgi:hypothetical protein
MTIRKSAESSKGASLTRRLPLPAAKKLKGHPCSFSIPVLTTVRILRTSLPRLRRSTMTVSPFWELNCAAGFFMPFVWHQSLPATAEWIHTPRELRV